MEQGNRRLIIIISLLLITGFLGISVTSYLVSSSSLRTHITQNELPLTGDNIYSEIQRDLLRPIFIASLMATDTFLRDWVLQGEKGSKKISHYLGEIKTKYNTFSSFFVSDATNRYYYPGGILKTVSEKEERDQWYFRIKNMDSEYEINLDPDMAHKDTMTIFINHRVQDYDGNYIGATGVGLAIHAVKNLINTYQRTYQRSIYFTDSNGRVTLHGKDFPDPRKNIFAVQGMAEHREDILKGAPLSFEYQDNGKTVYVNNRYIPEFGWYLFVEQRGDKEIDKIKNTLITNLCLSFVITALILLATNLTISSYQQRLTRMATIDKLTGIYNRRAFDIIMDQALKDLPREQKPFSLILFDMDHFKKVNDTHGHMAGDCVLQKVVETTANAIRSNDVLCRWGGEEFLVLLKECPLEDALAMAEKVRRAVEADPAVYQEKQIPATISLGVTEQIHQDTRESLLKRVDKALYAAKANGRNRCETTLATRE
ncbi:MAG: GGDEF domain-containing protein [Desulfobacterium sp.]|nr:GGDEF domain-containing protein [Desulfobacterium sp.]